ncbi:hypothetical protein SAMN03097699_0531 [Flavobacteriaceae bacterium MAR_2010_188]|nr:hypothetical protein SAMN03097699_0531 [Flavobacteriaceae bacterium MAR_2010_188]
MNTIYANFRTDWNKNFLGYSAMAIILSTCLGSIAIMSTMMHGNGFAQMVPVFFVVSACSAHNAAILTVQNPGFVLKLLGISVIISLVVLAIGLSY